MKLLEGQNYFGYVDADLRLAELFLWKNQVVLNNVNNHNLKQKMIKQMNIKIDSTKLNAQ